MYQTVQLFWQWGVSKSHSCARIRLAVRRAHSEGTHTGRWILPDQKEYRFQRRAAHSTWNMNHLMDALCILLGLTQTSLISTTFWNTPGAWHAQTRQRYRRRDYDLPALTDAWQVGIINTAHKDMFITAFCPRGLDMPGFSFMIRWHDSYPTENTGTAGIFRGCMKTMNSAKKEEIKIKPWILLICSLPL